MDGAGGEQGLTCDMIDDGGPSILVAPANVSNNTLYICVYIGWGRVIVIARSGRNYSDVNLEGCI